MSGLATAAHRHLVHFYQEPEEMAARAAAFLAAAAARGEALAAVCIKSHRVTLEDALVRIGIPSEQVLWLDADVVADTITGTDGRPDERLFLEHVARPIIEAGAAANGRVSVFGEAVTVLCARGQADAALRLEELWERLLERRAADVLCGYPVSVIDNAATLDGIRALHEPHAEAPGRPLVTLTEAIDLEGRDHLHPPSDTSDAPHLVRLQWQAEALRAEVALRRKAQTQLLARERELEARAANQESILRLGRIALTDTRLERLLRVVVEEVGRRTSGRVVTWCARTSSVDPLQATRDCDVCVPIRRCDHSVRGIIGLRDLVAPLTPDDQVYLANVSLVVAAAAQRADAHEALEAERAHLERVVDERTRHLVEANRELEAFNSSVSHDLRNHVRVVSGYAGLLAERHAQDLGSRGRMLVERLEHQSSRMAQVIDDLLALARVTRLEPGLQDVDLSALADEVAAHVAASHRHRVAWSVEAGLQVRADPALVRIVLENLLGNAWKFTRDTPSAHVWLGRRPDGALFVQDNGVGFPAQAASRLFQPFYRLHGDEYPGNGMGLATVGRIVSRHGGRAWAEGKEGEGATVCFSFEPLTE